MKNISFPCWVPVSAIIAFCIGCAAPQIQSGSANSVKTCIQGKVWLKSPVDAKQIPYAGASVNAWRHDKDQALVDTKTDSDGNYCMEVPAGNFRMDLRVWGMERMEGKSYICEGSAQNIDPGMSPKRCGEECFKTDILTQCEERADSRIGR